MPSPPTLQVGAARAAAEMVVAVVVVGFSSAWVQAARGEAAAGGGGWGQLRVGIQPVVAGAAGGGAQAWPGPTRTGGATSQQAVGSVSPGGGGGSRLPRVGVAGVYGLGLGFGVWGWRLSAARGRRGGLARQLPLPPTPTRCVQRRAGVATARPCRPASPGRIGYRPRRRLPWIWTTVASGRASSRSQRTTYGCRWVLGEGRGV